MFTVLGIWACVLDQIDRLRRLLESRPPDEPLSDDDKRALVLFLAPWQMMCEEAGFLTTLVPLQAVLGPLEQNRGEQPRHITWKVTARQALQRLNQIDEHLRHDSFGRLCYIVPDAKRDYASGRFLIDDLKASFPSASEDLIEAGRCYAFGRWRATIFHLIRAAEGGLKALARAAGVKGRIDFKEWGQVIRGIEEKVAVVDKWRRGGARANALEFYRGALADARALNNVWRTANLHVRQGILSDEDDARKAFDRTLDFLKLLATRLAEAQKRPLSKRSFEK